MKKYKLDNKALNMLTVILFIATNSIVAILKYLEYIKLGEISGFSIIVIVIVITLYSAYVVTAFFILPRWFRSVCYIVGQDEVIIESGVFVLRKVYVKISAIQYISVIKMPWYQHINMNLLLMNVYGGRICMLFLNAFQLEEIYKHISKYLKDRGGL